MSVPSGRLQFFALEASDYLDRLLLIVGRPQPPEPDELVRLTRALRGAALMAGLQPFARAAAGLEHFAKTHREQPATWGPARAEVVASAVEELKGLTMRAQEWSDREGATATDLARRLAEAAGAETAPVRPAPSADEVTPSVRTFIGREGALIAGTLEHAAQALELGQPAEAAELVLPRLQPLRGLATLPRLSPLPEFLDAIELTVRSIRDEAPPPGGPLALRRAAAAVTRLAREIADRGQAGADAPEVVLGAVSLLESFGREDDVVDIATLFRQGDAHPIVHRGAEPATPDDRGDGIIELVSLADRLRQAADQLGTPPSATGRTLYLYGLLVQLRPLTLAAPRERPHLAGLLRAVASAIGQGRASRAPGPFAEALREAGVQIARAAEARNAVFLAEELAPVIAALEALEATVTAEPPIVPIESLAPDDDASQLPLESVLATAAGVTAPVPIESLLAEAAGVSPTVPIESLLADPMGLPEPVPIESLAPSAPAAESVPAAAIALPSAFERSFSTYRRLITETPAVAVATPAAADTDVVPIGTLLFRGRRALERADTVRLALSQALKAQQPFDAIEPLVSELIDLVPLALEE